MVARRFLVRYEDDSFDLDYYTVDGIEVFKFRLFSLASIPPDQQKILGGDGDREIEILEDADLVDAPSQFKLVSVNEEDDRNNDANADLVMSDQELARMPQAEEEALEQRIQPYVARVLMYEDPVRQEAARKTVPVEELEEKVLVSLAKCSFWLCAAYMWDCVAFELLGCGKLIATTAYRWGCIWAKDLVLNA